MGIVFSMRDAVIVAGARTAVGRLLGSLSEFSATDLGGIAIKAALDRAGVPGDRVDYVIMGQVLQAGAGQIPSRQAAVAGGIPMSVPSLTINKVCLSGLDAIALAAQLIRAGEFDIVVAGGMESMTRAPHLLPGARQGFRFGSAELVDAMAYDGLTDAFDHLSMGESTERHNARLNITRQEQDEFAARSHQRAAAAASAKIRSLITSAKPDVVFTSSDRLAIIVYSIAADLHLRVGRDLAVVGFDGSIGADIVYPTLTSVVIPVEDIARRVVARALRQVETGSDADPGEIVPAWLRQAGSTPARPRA